MHKIVKPSVVEDNKRDGEGAGGRKPWQAPKLQKSSVSATLPKGTLKSLDDS